MNLGLDVGYGNVKAVYQREGILEMLKFPTAIAYAEREVGDLLVAQRHREPGPVVEGRVGDLVPTEAAVRAG